jgi:hypothetical protein
VCKIAFLTFLTFHHAILTVEQKCICNLSGANEAKTEHLILYTYVKQANNCQLIAKSVFALKASSLNVLYISK